MVIHYFCRLYSIISYYKIMASISCAVNNRGWDGWMASPAKRTRVWANSWRQWRTEKPALLQSMEWQSQHHLAAEQQQNSGYNSLCCKKRPCCSSILHMCVCVSHSGMSNSLWLRVQKPARLLCPWDFPGKNTGVGYHFLLQGIFPTQELNPGLLHCRQILHSLSHRVSSS